LGMSATTLSGSIPAALRAGFSEGAPATRPSRVS
jgi:hypothetical protein